MKTFGRTLLEKTVEEAKAFTIAPIFPFLRPERARMLIFLALAYVPLVNVIIARGWRKHYVHRIGCECEKFLPAPGDAKELFVDGLKLWLAHGAFLLPPIVIIATFGLGGWLDLWSDLTEVANMAWAFAWERSMPPSEFLQMLWRFVRWELISTALAFFINNLWLLIYVPIYRIGMIRYALTDNMTLSHLAVRKNLRFLFTNFLDIVLMYAFNVFNFILIITIDILLGASVIGAPLIPIVTFFMPFWNTGYEYGLIARRMAEQEKLEVSSPFPTSPQVAAS